MSPRTPPRVIFKRPFSRRPVSSIRTSIKSRVPRKSSKRFPRPTPCFRMSRSVRAMTPCARAIPSPALLRLRLMVAVTPAAPGTAIPLRAVFPLAALRASRVAGGQHTIPKAVPTWSSTLSSMPREAKGGARKTVRYTRFDTCGHCGGSGSVSSEHAHTCPSCGGRGHIDVDLSFLFGSGTFQSVCPECGGSGKVVADPCPRLRRQRSYPRDLRAND